MTTRFASRLKYLSLALVIALMVPAHGALAQGFVVIVNVANTASSISTGDLSKIFLKKVTKWRDNKTIAPVDQASSSRLRDTFARAVHNRSAAFINTYWQTQIFAGKDVPPVVKARDADVVEFVAANPQAIGYVKTGTPLPPAVKAITVTK